MKIKIEKAIIEYNGNIYAIIPTCIIFKDGSFAYISGAFEKVNFFKKFKGIRVTRTITPTTFTFDMLLELEGIDKVLQYFPF